MILSKKNIVTNRRASRPEPSLSPKAAALVRESWWLLVVALLTFLTLTLATYHKTDAGWSYSGTGAMIQNKGGAVGAWLSDLLFYLFGFSAWWWVFAGIILVVAGYRRIIAAGRTDVEPRHHPWLAVPGFVVLLLASAAVEALRLYRLPATLPQHPGGAIGDVIGSGLARALGFNGATLLLIALLAIGWPLLTVRSGRKLIERIGCGVSRAGKQAPSKRACDRWQGQLDRQADERPGARSVGGQHPRSRNDSRQVVHGAGAAESGPAAGSAGRAALVRGVQRSAEPAVARAGEGHCRQGGDRRSGTHAALAGRRNDGLGQIGRAERDDPVAAVQGRAAAGAVDPDRPKDARAVGLRGHCASSGARRHRRQARRQRARLVRRGDGAALPADVDAGCAQPRRLQRARRRGAQGEEAAHEPILADARQSRADRRNAADRRGDRRACRPDDGDRQEDRGADRADRAKGARGRHPPDPRDAAPFGRRHYRPHQGEHSVAHRVPGREQDRFAHHPRPDGCRNAARSG